MEQGALATNTIQNLTFYYPHAKGVQMLPGEQREVLESSTSPTGSVIAYTVCNVSVHWLSFFFFPSYNSYSSISYTSQFKLN